MTAPSVPDWIEPMAFTLRTMGDRIARVGDLWSDMHRRRRALRATERLRQVR